MSEFSDNPRSQPRRNERVGAIKDYNPGQPLTTQQFRVSMGDTDAARVIFYGAPLGWAERLLSSWLADSGFALSQMIGSGCGLPAVHVDVDYMAPLAMDDLVVGSLWLERKSKRSVTFRSQFARHGDLEPAVVVRATQVFADFSGGVPQAVELPPGLVVELEQRGQAAQSEGGSVAPHTSKRFGTKDGE